MPPKKVWVSQDILELFKNNLELRNCLIGAFTNPDRLIDPIAIHQIVGSKDTYFAQGLFLKIEYGRKSSNHGQLFSSKIIYDQPHHLDADDLFSSPAPYSLAVIRHVA